MAVYADRDRINLVFGKQNIDKWSDANNTGIDAERISRINWALQRATDYIDEKLRRTHYSIPFAAIPNSIVDLTATYAGYFLYIFPRGIVDSDDPILAFKQDADDQLARILSGQLIIDSVISGNNSPDVVNFSDDPTVAT